MVALQENQPSASPPFFHTLKWLILYLKGYNTHNNTYTLIIPTHCLLKFRIQCPIRTILKYKLNTIFYQKFNTCIIFDSKNNILNFLRFFCQLSVFYRSNESSSKNSYPYIFSIFLISTEKQVKDLIMD